MLAKTHVIKIGNSRGFRIPKSLLEHAGLENEVEMETHVGQLLIRPISQVRAGWDEAFKAMSTASDDKLLDESAHVMTDWELTEWTW